MSLIKFLQIPVLLFFLISDSSGIPIYPDDKHDDWMFSNKLDNKSENLVDNNKSMDFSLNSSDSTNNADLNIKDQIIKQIDEKLSSTDLSKIEIDRLKLFARNSLKSKSIESLTNSSELIIRNTEILIKKYKDQKKVCAADQTHVGDQSTGHMNEFCFNAFVKSFCPQFPFC